MPSRRAFLTTAGLAGLAGLAGCTTLSRVTGSSTPAPAPFLHEPTDWAHPRYDAGNTGAAPGAAAPDSLAAASTWTAEADPVEVDHVHAPVVADGIVYLPLEGHDGGEAFERLVAFDATTGEERWRYETPGSRYLSTPAVARETVYWLTDANRRVALNAADGSPQWDRSGVNHQPPVPAHGVVLDLGGSNTDPRLVARDPATGDPYWTRSAGGGDWDLVGADGEAFYVRVVPESQSPRLQRLDPTDGTVRWETDRLGPRDAVVHGGRLFAQHDEVASQQFSVSVGAVDTASGEWAWRRPRYTTAAGESPSVEVAAATDDRLLVHQTAFREGTDHRERRDRLVARDTETGEVRWTFAPEGEASVRIQSAVVAGARTFVLVRRHGYESELVTLSLGDGHVIGRRTLFGQQETAGATGVVPAAGALFVSGVAADGRTATLTRYDGA